MDSKREKIGPLYQKSLREKGAGLRAPEHVSRKKKGQETAEKRLFAFFTCEKVSSISLKLFFFSFSKIVQHFDFCVVNITVLINNLKVSEGSMK